MARIFYGDRGGGGGTVDQKSPAQIIGVGKMGDASVDDTRLLETGPCSPGKSLKFEILKLLKCIEIVTPTVTTSFNILRSYRWTFMAARGCLRTPCTSLSTGL